MHRDAKDEVEDTLLGRHCNAPCARPTELAVILLSHGGGHALDQNCRCTPVALTDSLHRHAQPNPSRIQSRAMSFPPAATTAAARALIAWTAFSTTAWGMRKAVRRKRARYSVTVSTRRGPFCAILAWI